MKLMLCLNLGSVTRRGNRGHTKTAVILRRVLNFMFSETHPLSPRIRVWLWFDYPLTAGETGIEEEIKRKRERENSYQGACGFVAPPVAVKGFLSSAYVGVWVYG
jgi:hypothetical protein